MTTLNIQGNIFKWLKVPVMSAISDINSGNVDSRILWSMQKTKPQNAPLVSLNLVQFDDTQSPVELRETFDTDVGTNPDINVTQNLIHRAVGSVFVSVFGASSFLHCTNIKTALREWPSIDAMNAQCLGLIGVGATQNLSAVIETDFESRAGFNLDFYFSYNRQIAVPSIGQVGIDGEVGLLTKDIVINEP